jgi:hypothetical protein
MRYEVQTYTLCDGWINCWTTSKGDEEPVPETFATREDAEDALDQYLIECAEAFECGDAEDVPDIEDFRIEPVKQA